MRKYFAFALTLLLFTLTPQTADAQKKETIYAYGFARCFNDTVVYLTSIQEIPEAALEKKTNFLIGRDLYGNQLKTYLESRYPGYATCVVIFDDKKSKIEKSYVKMRREYQKKEGLKLIEIPLADFKFKQTGIEP